MSKVSVAADGSKRGWALVVVCLGALMITLDGTIVIVALPSIGTELAFSPTSLVWIVNAYFLAFAGFLLLSGRLADLFGQRRLFLLGIALFTAASLGCGVAGSRGMLICARAVQGLGGAIISAVALSLISNLFPESAERARAVSILSFVCTAGGSAALLLGGVLTSAANWHWIFLGNLPIGLGVYTLGIAVLPKETVRISNNTLDVAGAVTITVALLIGVYATLTSNESGQTAAQTSALFGAAILLLVAFLAIEARVNSPLVPIRLFRNRNLCVATLIAVFFTVVLTTWYFISSLYLRLVLGYSPLSVGLSFLPANQIEAALTLGLSPRLVVALGVKPPLVIGLVLAAAGVLLFTFARVGGSFALDVLPGTILLGAGVGLAYPAILLAAMRGARPNESGVVAGVVNTASMMGGTIGLAASISAAASRTRDLSSAGTDALVALNSGYHLSFLFCTVISTFAAALGMMLPAEEKVSPH